MFASQTQDSDIIFVSSIVACNEQRVCDGDPNLACENVQGAYYCCDPLGSSQATTIASGLSSTVSTLTSTTTSLPPNQNSSSTNGVPVASLVTTTLSPGTSSLATSPGLSSNTSTVPPVVDPESTQCADQRPDVCVLITDMCTIPKHRPFVAEVCPRTCNLCPQPTECTDKYIANCRVWARNNFCNLVIYREETKRRLCGATCCMCNRNSQIANPLCPMSNSTRSTTLPSSLPTGSTPSNLSSSPGVSTSLPPSRSTTAVSGSQSTTLITTTLPDLLGNSSVSPSAGFSLPSTHSMSQTMQPPPGMVTQSTNNSSSSSTSTLVSTSGSILSTQTSTMASSSTRRNGQVRPRAGVGQNGSNGGGTAAEDGAMGEGDLDQGTQNTSTSTRRPRAGQ